MAGTGLPSKTEQGYITTVGQAGVAGSSLVATRDGRKRDGQTPRVMSSGWGLGDDPVKRDG